MTGPEHYREAESLLARVAKDSNANHGRRMDASSAMELHASIANGIAVAQVHATLALAAATAQCIQHNGAMARDECDVEGWLGVLA